MSTRQHTTANNTPQPEGMWALERDHPGLMAALYGAAIVVSLLLSHFWPRGAAQ